jgi:hypothetical protein
VKTLHLVGQQTLNIIGKPCWPFSAQMSPNCKMFLPFFCSGIFKIIALALETSVLERSKAKMFTVEGL